MEDFSASWIHYPAEPILLPDPAGGASIGNRLDGHRVKLFEESVTFIAQLVSFFLSFLKLETGANALLRVIEEFLSLLASAAGAGKRVAQLMNAGNNFWGWAHLLVNTTKD